MLGPKICPLHISGNLEAYKSMLHSRVMSTLNAFNKESDSGSSLVAGTRIYPLLQMGIVSINQEFEFLKNLLSLQVLKFDFWQFRSFPFFIKPFFKIHSLIYYKILNVLQFCSFSESSTIINDIIGLF